MKPATQTKLEVAGRPIMVRVFDDHIELRRKGERNGRRIAIDEVWRLANDEQAPPPLTWRTTNRIVAVFVKVSGNKSLWQRQDTGEITTEAKIMAQGRREKRPVVTLFGMPNVMAVGR